MINNIEPVPMPQHGRVIPLAELRQTSDRERQTQKFDALAEHWNKFDTHRLRVMQQIAGVLKQQGGTLEGRNLKALEALHNEFFGGGQ